MINFSKVELNIISNSTCHDNYVAFDIGIKGDMICVFKGPLGTETICNGDSGGPLMVSVKLYQALSSLSSIIYTINLFLKSSKKHTTNVHRFWMIRGNMDRKNTFKWE